MAKERASARAIDFSNVKDGGGRFNKKRVQAGDYLARVTKVEDAESKKDETFQYLFTVKLEKYSQYAYPYYCKLQENQLWKLRNLLIAAGLNVPKKRVKLDPNKVVGKLIGVTMEDDEYEGKMQSSVAAVFPASELSGAEVDDEEDEDDETEEEEETEEVDSDEEEDEGDELEGMDRSELKAHISENDLDIKVKKSMSDDDIRGLIRAAGSDEDEEEDDEEEEPAPPPKKSKSKKGKKSKPAKDDDELEELDLEDL